uniref:Protein kinase domain-containing protein n=1 Tax=Macrostomum lignano TaxID=282301 RepID=A0A1I8HD38_9PLAT
MLVDYRNNSGSDSCSQHDAAAALLYNQLQQQSSSAAVQQEQSLGGSSSQLQAGAATGQQQQQSEQLAALLKAREQLERQVANQHKLIETLRENQERGREVLRALLAEKSRQERRAVRDRCRENRLRLGQFQIVRHGSDLLDKWFDGFAFEEAHRRRQEIEHGKERIEKERRLWMKRKPAAGGTTTKSASSRSTSSAGKHSEVDADEFFTQLEIYDIQRQALVKDEKDLRDEVEKLDRERNVHKAYDMTEHRFVACKIHQLSPSWPKEKKDNYIRHAVREIEIHKTLQHPRIVKVYDVFDIDSDCFCTVLEYSKGCDLDFYLKQNKSLPEREARNVICQVVSALKYLNQRRPPVIHYDLKPGNILLGEGDSVADIKLTDFGLSKVMTEDKFQADSGMDLTSQGAGTYWYLPPECFETGPEAPKISSKVDVWSVGVIFYQCLYGQKPFGNNMTQADILRNHTILKALKIDFPQSTPGNCKVSEPAKNFIRRCVTYDKRQRPDVFQLAEDEYLKSKAQLKFDTTTAAYSPAGVGSGSGSGGSSAWGLMPPPGPV